jgi:periplasmic divalent cation tolerance protein
VTDLVIVLTTVPAGDAGDRVARSLVDERLAACVNVLAPMTSTYRWRGAVEVDAEQQLIIKTRRSLVPRLTARLAALHPYELPEVLVVDVAQGSDAYLAWVRDSTSIEPAPTDG